MDPDDDDDKDVEQLFIFIKGLTGSVTAMAVFKNFSWMRLTGMVGWGLEPVCDAHRVHARGDNPGHSTHRSFYREAAKRLYGVDHGTAKAAFWWSWNRPETRHLGLCGETPTLWQELKCVTHDISNWQPHTHTHTESYLDSRSGTGRPDISLNCTFFTH